MRFVPCALLLLLATIPPSQTPPRAHRDSATGKTAASSLQDRISAAPTLPFQRVTVPVHLPPGQQLGMVSWLAPDAKRGLTWILQRGDEADPVLAVNASGQVVHAFGKGSFTIPHALRLDPEGHLWTVDAGSSRVIEWTPEGNQLLTLDLSGPRGGSSTANFGGATDIAFSPHGRLFVSDGYRNARIVEFTRDGRRIGQWGTPGTAPGQFNLPHAVTVDPQARILYVADRENGRIQSFDLHGHFLKQFTGLERIYALALGPDGTLWASVQLHKDPPGSAGWLVQLDRSTGKMLGYIAIPEAGGLHTVTVNAKGEPSTDLRNGVLLFVRR